MTTLKCPKCDAEFPCGEGWAQSAVATMIAAPAVPDMASQVRCPKCHHFFADSEVRHLRSSWSPIAAIGLAIIGAVLLMGLVYHVLSS